METKILFTDMDGTLLNDSHTISQYTKKQLDTMISLGHTLVLSSGRPLDSILKTKEKLQLDYPGVYIISYNGGLIYECDTKISIYEKRVPFQDTQRILGEANKLGIYCHTYSDTHIIAKEQSAELDHYQTAIDIPSMITHDIMSALSQEPFKLLAIHLSDKRQLNKLKEVVTSFPSNKISCVFSNENYLEFFPISSGKGNALQYLCHYLGISLDHAVAVGDAENDISMLQSVTHSVAMNNASQIVKDSATDRTLSDNNHDGITEVLKKYFF